MNVHIVEGILDGMSQVGLDLKLKPKLMGEGKGLKRELRAPPHHLRLKYKRPNNVFGDELSLDALIRSHMQNMGYYVGERPHLNS